MFRCAFARTNWLLAMVDVPPHLAEREGRKGVARAGATPRTVPRQNRGHPGVMTAPEADDTLPRGFCRCWERVSDLLAARTRSTPEAGGHPRAWRTGTR